ncbi:hypothetical protein JW859_03230 [bacterium]|nr:hypothetical protein [bacterium]
MQVVRYVVLFLIVVLLLATGLGSCAGGRLDQAAGDARPAVLGQPVDTTGADPAVMAQLAGALERQLVAQGDKGLADVTGVYVSTLTITPVGGDVRLEWDYNNRGDYNQDGFVTVNDLTPIGVHFGKDTSAGDWAAASCADGNQNGLVEVSDITPIGQNFNSAVLNYVVEADIGGGNWQPVANIPRGNGAATATSDWMHYTQTIGNGGAAADFRVFAGPEADPLYALDPAQAMFNPENWVTHEVVSGSDIGNNPDFIDLALVGGLPAMVFVDSDSERIRYARAIDLKPTGPSQWIITTVDDSDTMTGPVHLVECYGVPCVTYKERTSGDCYFAYASSLSPSGTSDWTVHELDFSVLTPPYLAVTGSDQIASVYKASGPSITYAESNTAAGVPPAAVDDWDTSIVDDSASDLKQPQLAFVNGHPVIAYQWAGSSRKELRYAYDEQVTTGAKAPTGISIVWTLVTINEDNNNSGNDVELLVVNDLPVMSYVNIGDDYFDEYLLLTLLDVPNPASATDWTTITVRDQTADRIDVGVNQTLAWYNNRPFFLHIVSEITSSTLEITYANTETPAGPGDFTSGVLYDPAASVLLNGQNLSLLLPDDTLMIGYRTNEGLQFAYFEAP